MNQEVTNYFQKLPKWQTAVCESLRTMIAETVPIIEERMQYGKPHYLKNGHFACVIHAAKEKVSFMIFNAGELQEIKGFFKSMSTPDRKTAAIIEGQEVDYGLLATLLKQASESL
ncbi:DUF1801 domain-containing protein [Spirosoma endbachense]|uniref:DUF1801 domain-containing protein n=1 Tax=Spirosoma endbachense TaxID=2666025 RepID=A0A6P1VYC1_9BACT|nr:DUF1801 domain-containing protein [Spirosoma endbachense]QHV97308.1 DUF1801 domain-containing protein [Spirosoma endbachense]